MQRQRWEETETGRNGSKGKQKRLGNVPGTVRGRKRKRASEKQQGVETEAERDGGKEKET